MPVSDLERLFDYCYWANRRHFAVISQLTPEQFTMPVTGAYGSIRNTLVHMLSAEWGWMDRCGGLRRGPALRADDFPTLQSVTDTWSTVESHVRSFLGGLTDEDLTRTVEHNVGGARVGTVGELLQHAANHGVHHRGQIALLLRSLGVTPGNVDLLIYHAERRAAVAS